MYHWKNHNFDGMFLIGLWAVISLVGAGCAVQPAVSKDSIVKPPVDEFESELTALRNADFDYIYSFRRKDGNPMDSDDKRFVKNNSHFATNRFTLSKDEKVIFAGSNYRFPEDGLAALKDRFEFGDYSKPEAELEKKRKEREAQKEKLKKGSEAESENG